MLFNRDTALTRVELARLEGSVTALTATVAAGAAGHTDHETRIRQLERWAYSVPLSAAAAILAAAAAWLRH